MLAYYLFKHYYKEQLIYNRTMCYHKTPFVVILWEKMSLNVNYSVNTLQLGINSFNHRILDGRSEEC